MCNGHRQYDFDPGHHLDMTLFPTHGSPNRIDFPRTTRREKIYTFFRHFLIVATIIPHHTSREVFVLTESRTPEFPRNQGSSHAHNPSVECQKGPKASSHREYRDQSQNGSFVMTNGKFGKAMSGVIEDMAIPAKWTQMSLQDLLATAVDEVSGSVAPSNAHYLRWAARNIGEVVTELQPGENVQPLVAMFTSPVVAELAQRIAAMSKNKHSDYRRNVISVYRWIGTHLWGTEHPVVRAVIERFGIVGKRRAKVRGRVVYPVSCANSTPY